jgi:Fic family protein
VDVKNIIDDINYIENISLDDICEFHCRFEKIHPFQDGNGRIGRLVMLKQCLQANIIPFFINNNTREEYINCMKLFHRTGMSSFLSEYCAKQQKIFIQTYSEYLDNELNNNEKAIIDYLTNKKVATAEEISKLLNLGKTATNDNFNKLIDREIVERINAGKNTAYILKTK